uniref:putative golgin subfamily A member 6-like protein 3 isoform X1 n=1 Tax=Styela clava TaxID=7725 RepID=UPI00193A2BE8|nr:putative golgin subfamily A member 6-like protein 3 isoform X1 [Styela clava]
MVNKMNFQSVFICLCVGLAVVVGQDIALKEQTEEKSKSKTRLVCFMDKTCARKDKCELPCEFRDPSGAKSDQGMTTSNFIDDEFEELWDEMQNKMKGLNDHQAELIAQQHDLLKQQQKLEFENRKLKSQQSDLLERQKDLEEENERLKTIAPVNGDDEEVRKMVKNLEKKIKVLTEQQKKLSSQQTRLVEQQNRLMSRQSKLEKENSQLKRRQKAIEARGFGPTTPSAPTTVETVPEKIDPRVESKLDAIKKEMQYRIEQLSGQQQQLLKEQTRLINRQMRLENENEELRKKQAELYIKQEELEKENQELKANLTHQTTDPEVKRERIESRGLCVIEHGDICFSVLGDGSDELTYDLARENCKMHGGDLANVYDQEHYEKLKKYFIDNDIESGVWIGMTYNPISYKAKYTNGKEAKFVLWNWVYPASFATYTKMYLYIDKDPESIYSGMVNLPGNWKYPYALCQFGM